ncbi:hypothetical protein ACIQZG_19205 [Lysinibacillus sp. NPDC096418]|uniref:hypothetical protein n=1 Tax=Lysinibacillus sp. NPDC096418 TaxID=3364138 RepID=UPI00380B69E4
MNIVVVIFLSLIAVSIGIIIFTLYSIAKRQDERQDYIKSKAMSYTFSVIIGLLVIEVGVDIYRSSTEQSINLGMSSYVLLFTICIVYLASLLFFSRKYA